MSAARVLSACSSATITHATRVPRPLAMPPHWRILSGAANGANLPTKTDKGGDALDFNVCHQFGRLFRNQRRATAPPFD
jgi:hypothetical protein